MRQNHLTVVIKFCFLLFLGGERNFSIDGFVVTLVINQTKFHCFNLPHVSLINLMVIYTMCFCFVFCFCNTLIRR